MWRTLYLFYSIALPISVAVASPARIPNSHKAQQALLPADQHVLSPGIMQNCDGIADAEAPQPLYIIAHRVLVAQGIRDAISHGANAVKIDLTAWNQGWYADHGNMFGMIPEDSPTDTARKMFETIAKERKAGKTVTFVWLDIKNPMYCEAADPKWRHCSIDALRDLTRELLEPHGVRILYGFDKTVVPNSLLESLNTNEAINLNGPAEDVARDFESQGPAQIAQRAMSYGFFCFPFCFDKARKELAKAVASKKFGKVFGWTTAVDQSWNIDTLLGDVGVDGLIYGFQKTHYYDDNDTRATAQDIINWVQNHSDSRYIAEQDDSPW